MADSTKYIPINPVSDLKLKNIFSFRTRTTRAFVSVSVSVFVLVTFFLAFNPSSDPSSPSFTNIFTDSRTFKPNATDDSRSQFSSIYSYFFPSNITEHVPNVIQDHPFGSFGENGSTQTATRSPISQNGSTQTANGSPNDQTGSKQSTKQSMMGSPISQNGSTQTSTGSPISQNGSTQTAIKSPNDENGSTQTAIGSPNDETGSKQSTMGSPKSQTGSNQSTMGSPKYENISNQSVIKSPSTQLAKNQTVQETEEPVNNNVVKKPVQETEQSVPKSMVNDTLSGPSQKIDEKNRVNNGNNNISSLEKKQGNNNSEVKQGIEYVVKNLVGCDLFDGEWVRDDSYPLYEPGSCSLIDEQFNCFANGRKDLGFQNYKWKPKGCTLPRLDGSRMLELLRGKRLVFVGDSLNRNMWESLICILRNSVQDKTKVYEASGRHHFRSEASYAFVFKDYNCTVEFFVAPFLVQEWETKDKNGTKKETLRLDLVNNQADLYKTADVLVFNTGHWWTHDKTAKGQDYYQVGGHVYKELNVLEAFRKAMTTWGMWVDANINPTKTSVFFRGYSASHFSGGQWNSGGACDHESEPINNTTYLTPYPDKMVALEKVFKGMKTGVSYINITRLTDFRKDGHPSIYRKQHYTEEEIKSPLHFQDCSHWCLPGVPDAWNEILFGQLLVKQYQSQQKM